MGHCLGRCLDPSRNYQVSGPRPQGESSQSQARGLCINLGARYREILIKCFYFFRAFIRELWRGSTGRRAGANHPAWLAPLLHHLWVYQQRGLPRNELVPSPQFPMSKGDFFQQDGYRYRHLLNTRGDKNSNSTQSMKTFLCSIQPPLSKCFPSE